MAKSGRLGTIYRKWRRSVNNGSPLYPPKPRSTLNNQKLSETTRLEKAFNIGNKGKDSYKKF